MSKLRSSLLVGGLAAPSPRAPPRMPSAKLASGRTCQKLPAAPPALDHSAESITPSMVGGVSSGSAIWVRVGSGVARSAKMERGVRPRPQRRASEYFKALDLKFQLD